jgi:hypothetical protein
MRRGGVATGAAALRHSVVRGGETDHQQTLVEWAALMAQTTMPELVWLHAVPNGGLRSRATAGRLRAEGVKSGVPDLVLPVPRAWARGAYLEVKAPSRDKRPTPEQQRWLAYLDGAGYFAALVYGVDAGRAALEWYVGGPADGHAGLRLERACAKYGVEMHRTPWAPNGLPRPDKAAWTTFAPAEWTAEWAAGLGR